MIPDDELQMIFVFWLCAVLIGAWIINIIARRQK